MSIQVADGQVYSVFKSTDQGQTWMQADNGLSNTFRINALVCSENDVLAGTDRGVFRSSDGGDHWQPALIEAGTTSRILCFARSDEVVYGGTDGDGVIMSADGGSTWAQIPGLSKYKVRCLLIHRQVLYVGTDAHGVVAWDIDNQTQTSLDRGWPDDAQVFDMAISRDRLFAAIYSKGLIAWDETSDRWQSVSGVLPLVLSSDGDTLMAGQNPGGLHWSTDDGTSWHRAHISAGEGELAVLNPQLASVPVWAMSAGSGLALAGAADGVFRSVDQGRNWDRISAGLPVRRPGIAMCIGTTHAFVALSDNESTRTRIPTRIQVNPIP